MIDEYVINIEQSKFFVDVSNDKESQALIIDLQQKSYNKEAGVRLSFKELCLLGLSKITDKDIKELLASVHRVNVQLALDEFNAKNGTKLELGKSLIM